MTNALARVMRSELPIVLGLAVLTAAWTAGPFLWSGQLQHDTLASYSFFFDNLDSLNRFGEPAWWSPHIHNGTPTYFYGLIGIPSLGKPAFVAMGAIAWLLGRLGIGLPFVMPLYVFYFGLLIPFLFLLGVWLVGRQILRSRTAIRYALIVAAFSPGVLVNLTDPGNLENTAYGLFCAAAYLRFLARPDGRRFAMLCAAALFVSIAISHPALVTSLPMLAVLLCATLGSRAARRAWRSLPPAHALVALVLLLATATPSLLAYRQQHDAMTYSEVGSLEYAYGNLKAGNPLQFLLVSLPGTVFEWDSYRQAADGPPSQLGLRSLRWGEVIGENYLGLLALPLALVGFVYGRRRVRVPLFWMWILSSAVLVLFAASPLLAPLLLISPALRTNNHFSDLTYAGGGFLLLVFAAALGLEAAERRPAVLAKVGPFFALVSAVSLGCWVLFAQPPPGLAGFAVVMAVGFSVLFVWASRLPRRSRSHLFVRSLLALALLDVATASFWYTRFALHGATRVYDAGLGKTIGTRDGDARSIAELFVLKDTKALLDAGIDPNGIPFLEGFCRAHLAAGAPSERDVKLATNPDALERSLAIPEASRSDPALQPFLTPARVDRCDFQFQTSGTYDALRIRVVAAQPGLVFVRDANSPQWRATRDGKPAEIHPALGAFKAIVVPAGASELRLRFAPRLLGASLLGAYAILAGVLWFASRRR